MKKIDFPSVQNLPTQLPPLKDSARLRKSIRGMNSVLVRSNIILPAAVYINAPTGDYGQAIQRLDTEIGIQIADYLKSPSNALLTQIFHYIQLWGGQTGRNVYVMNGGFDKNFSPTSYSRIINKVIQANPGSLCQDLKEIEKLCSGINQLGVSFATKHMRFWAMYGNSKVELPILDRVIATKLYGRDSYANWKNYCSYAQQMQQEAQRLGTSVSILERSLFNILLG
jgi:hypothetical protein